MTTELIRIGREHVGRVLVVRGTYEWYAPVAETQAAQRRPRGNMRRAEEWVLAEIAAGRGTFVADEVAEATSIGITSARKLLGDMTRAGRLRRYGVRPATYSATRGPSAPPE